MTSYRHAGEGDAKRQHPVYIVEELAVTFLSNHYFPCTVSPLFQLHTLIMRSSSFLPLLGLAAQTLAYTPHAPSCQTTQFINGYKFPTMIDVTLEDLIYGLESGLFTSTDLVNTYVDRILEVNSMLHMVTELNPDALSIAKQYDAMRAAGNVTGPLHGIPVLIKNNIATDDLMNNTAGSFALLGAKVPRDSTMAAKLRQVGGPHLLAGLLMLILFKAGAILLGKTNLSQWANYRSDNTSNGWSAYGGQTQGAYFPAQVGLSIRIELQASTDLV